MKTLLGCGLALALLAGEARAVWVRVSQNYQIAQTQYVIDPGHPDYLERGWLTKGAGGHASGEVVAEDRYFLGRAPSVQLVGTGFSYEHWRHLPRGSARSNWSNGSRSPGRRS